MKKDFVISNPEGLHARPATLLVSKANQFKSKITLTFDSETVDLKSIMGVLSLGVQRGSLVTITTEGEDGTEAMEAISLVIAENNLR